MAVGRVKLWVGGLALSLVLATVAVGEPAGTMHASPVAEQTSYALAPFGEVSVYRPAGEPKGVVLFLSDADGWGKGEGDMARALSAKGLLVAGVSTAALAQVMESNGAKCVDPNYSLIDLSRDLQHRMGVASYHKPLIVGYGMGAAMAYAGIAQWPNAGYQGVVSIAFAPDLPGRKPWCAAPGFAVHHIAKGGGWRFVPGRHVRVPWVVMQRRAGERFAMAQAQHFIAAVPGARLIQLPPGGGDSGPVHWTPQLAATVLPLLPPPPPKAAPGQAAIPDMPLTLIPAAGAGAGNGGRMAILYSGDGGWVGIDRDVAAQLAASGISVVGVDSLSYFWSARTPAGAGRDLGQLIAAFSQRWNRPRVMLIGYSFGADAMPHMINALDPAARAKVESVALLGFSDTADFQFHMTSWLNIASDDALPTLPAVIKLKGMTIRCVRGMAESDSACPAIPRGVVQQFLVPGDHHFNRNAPLLAHILLGQRRPGTVVR